MCANTILYRYLLGHLTLLDLMISFMLISLIPTSLKEGVRSDCQVFRPHLVGESSAQCFTANFVASSNYDECDSFQRCALASLQYYLAPLDCSLLCSHILFLSYSASEFFYSTDSLVITCYCVTCVCLILTLLQVPTWPSGPSAFFAFYPLPERKCVQTIRSFQLRLVSEYSIQGFITRFVRVELCQIFRLAFKIKCS